MKTIRPIAALLATVVMTVFLFGCRKKVSYPFRVINNSPYTIEVFSVGEAVKNRQELSIAPFDTSQIFFIRYKKQLRMNPERTIFCDVVRFSNSTENYSNNRSILHRIDKKDFSLSGTNTIRLEAVQLPDSTTADIFGITMD